LHQQVFYPSVGSVTTANSSIIKNIMAKQQGPEKYWGGQSGGHKAAPAPTSSAQSANEVPAQVPAETGVPQEQVSAATTEAPVSGVSATPTTVQGTTGQEKPESSVEQDDALVLDPNKPILLPNGERLSFADFNNQRMKHDKYIAGMTQVDKDKKALQAKAQELTVKETIADSVMKSQRLALVTKLVMDGMSEEEAFRKAGVAASTPEPTVTGPTIVVSGITIPAPPTDDLESQEYADWYNSHYKGAVSRAQAKAQVDPEIQRLTQLVESLVADKNKEIELGTQFEQNLAASNEALNTWTGHLQQITGINYNTLTPEQQQETQMRVLQGLMSRGINPNNPQSLAARPIESSEIYDAVFQAYAQPVNPYFRVAEKEKPVELAKPRVNGATVISGSPQGQIAPSTKSGGANRFATAGDRALGKYFS